MDQHLLDSIAETECELILERTMARLAARRKTGGGASLS
jgi:DNA invertase Pin-like site-specific DNA recombinase